MSIKNLQIVATGTVRPCKFCGVTFTVERNPNRSGLFCSVSCGRKFARSKRTHFFQRIETRRREATYENMLRPARPAAKVETPLPTTAEIEKQLRRVERETESKRLASVLSDLDADLLAGYEYERARDRR